MRYKIVWWILIVIIALAAAMYAIYMITAPIYKIAYELEKMNKNIPAPIYEITYKLELMEKTLSAVPRVDKNVQSLEKRLTNLNAQIGNSTLLKI